MNQSNYVPAQPETFTAQVPPWEMGPASGKLQAAGIEFTPDYPNHTLTVPAAQAEAAQEAIATKSPRKPRRKVPSIMGNFGTIWFGVMAIGLVAFIPQAAVFAAIGAGIFAAWHAVSNGLGRHMDKRANATNQLQHGWMNVYKAWDIVGFALAIVVLGLIAGIASAHRLGVPIAVGW